MLKSCVVVLLTLIPITLLPAQTLGPGDPEKGREKSQQCAACHGGDGNSANTIWPKLAGQHSDYIVSQLRAFQSGARQNEQMSPMAQGLSEQDMEDIAAFYATQDIRIGKANPASVEAGAELYRGGNSTTGVPACIACHGPRGKGIPGVGYPRLGGQHAEYTAAQLKAYRSGERGGGQSQIMQTIAAELTDDEIRAVSEYLNGLH